jgi:diadenosine tetraphosphatase ApaH/serine/threonine PP2A family protein phosphatase
LLIALFTDIHANREAFEACLADAATRPVDRYVFLGDYVGYGADPAFAVDTVAAHVERGAVALLGNHDAAASGTSERMTEDAALAIEWTAGQLDTAQRNFLSRLPLTAEDGDRLYVHSSAAAPASWPYVIDERAAGASLQATAAQVTFCGHTHLPALFHLSVTGKLARFDPTPGVAIPLSPQRRWLAVIGSVGQPRDRNPAACYALYDDAARALTYVRVPYDIDSAAAKIRAAGLPAFLAARLAWGR